jgi:hypothetical protein
MFARKFSGVPLWLFLVALATLAPVAARAATFDLIFADSIEYVRGPLGSGFSLGNEIALIVNKGPTNIGESELSATTFTVSTSDPGVQAWASILNTQLVTPILPNEAVGTLNPGIPLSALLQPGEALRNVFPVGLFWLGVSSPVGYTGTFVVEITMTMGINVAHYSVLVKVTPGSEVSLTVVSADRVSSTSPPTPTRASTWGQVKSRYRTAPPATPGTTAKPGASER